MYIYIHISYYHGSQTFDQKEIHEMATNHFSFLLQPNHYLRSPQLLPWLQTLISYCCSSQTKVALCLDYSPKEITSSLFKMPANKTPRIDGFTSEFYKQNWKLIGAETLEFMHQFFVYAFMPTLVNAATLVLIPRDPRCIRIE